MRMEELLIGCFSETLTWTRLLKAPSSLEAEGREEHVLDNVRLSMPTESRTRSTKGAENGSSATLFYLSGVSSVDSEYVDRPEIQPGDILTDVRGRKWTAMSTTFLLGLRGEYRHMEVVLR